ncbi:MAG: hypothetical protein WCX29_01490 [Candidatus Peribacteraceae bacterium]|nr:hypothetical protein [Candidatus Peribacteria bacterium]
MPLQDILNAIAQDADTTIAQERAQHQKRLAAMREESERAIAKRKQAMGTQKEERKQQMLRKAQAHSAMLIRNAELRSKRALLDELYNKVVGKLATLTEKETEALLKRCLKSIVIKGAIHPSKSHQNLLKRIAPSEQFTVDETIDAAGGFRFIAEREERDCTYEHLVNEYLRPATEIEAAHKLFDHTA